MPVPFITGGHPMPYWYETWEQAFQSAYDHSVYWSSRYGPTRYRVVSQITKRSGELCRVWWIEPEGWGSYR